MKWRRIWRWRSPLLLLFLCLLLCSILLVSPLERNLAHSPAGRLTLTVFTPFVRVGKALNHYTYQLFYSLIKAHKSAEETQRLRVRIAELEAEAQVLKETNYLLSQMLGLKHSAQANTFENLPAQVVGFSLEGRSKTVLIDKGRADDIKENMPVINEEGLIGFISRAARHSAEVQLLIDPMTAVGVILEQSRHRGILFGKGHLSQLELMLDTPAEVQAGERLITAGMGHSVYPRGLRVGEIAKIEKNKYGGKVALARPYVNFSRLEVVLIILGPRENYQN